MYKQKIALLENTLKDTKQSEKEPFPKSSLPGQGHRAMHVNTIGASPVKAALYS